MNSPKPQCSSGTTQSRPFPARAVKVMESAGHCMRSQTRVGCKPEGEIESPGEQQKFRSDASSERDSRERPAPISPAGIMPLVGLDGMAATSGKARPASPDRVNAVIASNQ